MNIIYTSCNKFAPYCGISILSLFENNKDVNSINVYIIDGGISDENKQKFSNLEEEYNRNITLLDRNKEIEEIKRAIPPFRCHPLIIIRAFPKKVFPNVDKILSIGADTIVNQSIESLFNMDIEDFLLAAVPVPEFYNGVSSEDPAIIARNPYYFNGEIILFNLKQWRQKDYDRKLLTAFNERSFLLAEQSAFAYVINPDEIKKLPPKYNYWGHEYTAKTRYKALMSNLFFSKEEIDEAHNNPVIIHYKGRCKRPWIDGAEIDPKYIEIFQYYKAKSPWSDIPQESIDDYYKWKFLPFYRNINRRVLHIKKRGPFWMKRIYHWKSFTKLGRLITQKTKMR